jgi:hypothetical protein
MADLMVISLELMVPGSITNKGFTRYIRLRFRERRQLLKVIKGG